MSLIRFLNVQWYKNALGDGNVAKSPLVVRDRMFLFLSFKFGAF